MREWFDHGFDGDSAVKSATQCSVWVLPKCTGPCYTQRTTRSPKQNYTAVHLKLPPGQLLTSTANHYNCKKLREEV